MSENTDRSESMTGTPSKDRAEARYQAAWNLAGQVVERPYNQGTMRKGAAKIENALAAAHANGFAEGMKRAAEICAEVEAAYLEPEYTTDQPLGSIAERCACRSCSTHILAEIGER